MKKDDEFVFEGKPLFTIKEDNVELKIQLNNEKELLDFVRILDERKNNNSTVFDLLKIVEVIIIENKIHDSDIFRKYHIKDIDKNLRIAFSETEKFINFSKEYEQLKNNPDFNLKDLIKKYDICPNCIDEFYNGENDSEYDELQSYDFFSFTNQDTEYDHEFEREHNKISKQLEDLAKQKFDEKKKKFSNFLEINDDINFNLNKYYAYYNLINIEMGIIAHVGYTEIEKEDIDSNMVSNSIIHLDNNNVLNCLDTSTIVYLQDKVEKALYHDINGYYVVHYTFQSSKKDSSFFFKDFQNALDYFLDIKDLKEAIHSRDILKFANKNTRKQEPS